MRIGLPKETKNHEYRLPLTPMSVAELAKSGHQLLIGKDAGDAIGFSDAAYREAGGIIVEDPQKLYQQSDLILKVKEPSLGEIAWLQPGQVIFSYMHLASNGKIASALLKSGATVIAFETIEDTRGHLPLLAPMSEIAGRLSVQAGAHALEMAGGGRGVLLAGASGVLPARVVVIGGGVAGENAARMGLGLGADVTILDIDPDRLRELQSIYGAGLKTLHSNAQNIETALLAADLTIGAVLIPGAAAPRLISRGLISRMKKGAVLVDIAIDQGGISETSRPTSHDNPTYVVDGVVHYCVTNIPGAVARTASEALNNAVLPFLWKLAENGVENALRSDACLRSGLNIYRSSVTHKAVARALGKRFKSAAKSLGRAEIHEVA